MLNAFQRNLTKKWANVQTNQMTRNFGRKSAGQWTPHVFRNPKHTREGYFKPNKSRVKQYDLEDVTNAHLYYDHKSDAKI